MTTELNQTFRLERTVNAPQRTVWKALTEADQLKHWWGPAGFTMKSCTVDLRPGGLFHYGMTAPDGTEMWGKWTYREIVPQEKLVFVNSFSDAEGNTCKIPFSETWPEETLSTIRLEDLGPQTKLILAATPINASEISIATFIEGFGSMEQGFGGTFAQLEAYLKTL